MTHYHSGRQLEWDVRNLFTAAGWSVIRGAGSKGEVDGFKADLVATRRGSVNEDTVYLVAMQCKRQKRKGRK